jgi:hypothetical protein
MRGKPSKEINPTLPHNAPLFATFIAMGQCSAAEICMFLPAGSPSASDSKSAAKTPRLARWREAKEAAPRRGSGL